VDWDVELTRQVTRIIAQVLRVSEHAVALHARIADDLGAPPLRLVTLVLALEDIYHVDITDDELEDLRTPHDLIECVRRHLGRPAAGSPG
jgi:acyl carrier protein